MSSASASAPFQAADYEFAQDLLDGDRTAWGRFDQELKPAMLSKLLASGATNADAQEVIGIVMEKLWAQKKLAAYTGPSLSHLIEPPTTPSTTTVPDRHVFRIQGSRVYYVRESLANLATSVARDNLLSLGTCLGKFTKTGKFRMHITALDVIAPHARYKVWIKPNGEMPFLYGGHVVKAHVGRWSEDCPEHQGVVVLNMNDTPLVSL